MKQIILVLLFFLAIPMLKQINAENSAFNEALLKTEIFEAYNSNPVETAIFEAYETSNKECNEFQKQLAWFLEMEKPLSYKKAGSSETNEPEEEELKMYFQRKREESYNDLVTKVMLIQELFKIFKENLSDLIALKSGGEGLHANSLRSDVVLETTQWYISFIKKNLFYPGWESDYDSYCESKRECNRTNVLK